ncbi:hypothetical protein [Roseofilum sp. Guam]|uniref:hypothetical protein n=1 Tax=Roseofilum sp. Guam TaxID=2821502 RepID=UPI001B2B5632|nr:hypothetical protein [Roseofilum sp. Guam]MBP0029592.1 hypothetical protein [Roseofilum sp. Guam]
MTPVELARKGFKVLVDNLGYVDSVKFLRLFDPGHGDYTAERHQWLDEMSMDDILADIHQRQKQSLSDTQSD